MKIFRMLGRSIRDAFKSVIRNFSLSLASISCITITLIIVAIAIMASFNVQNFTKEIEKDLTIVIFLNNDATEEDVTSVEQRLRKIPNVDKKSITFESKQEVKEDMQKESEVFDTVLDEWDDSESPLKDTFQVKVKNVENIALTAKKIEKIDQVNTVRYGEGMVDKMITAFSSIEKVTCGIVIALVVVTIFLIINTIKLTISARRREIGIMRLVGASNFTIKTPFIIEGMILGLLGSIVPIIFTTYGYLAFYNHFDGYLFTQLIQLIKPEPFIYSTAGIVVIIGILVGMVGSAGAVRKYLKI
ncbi:MAG: permease-like cell division protein FtsX [bacterium]|nr:permease-like cell division protein FtsX [Mycoplasmatota bacterium]MDD6757302.1 permease-like cell division protein FtsX [bacterium]MDY2907976.1 permease-like cell division protein FtsX [Candidatus Faecimonas sp.]